MKKPHLHQLLGATCISLLALTGCSNSIIDTNEGDDVVSQSATPTQTTTPSFNFDQQTLSNETKAHAWLKNFTSNNPSTQTHTSILQDTTGELEQAPFTTHDTHGVVHVYSPAGALWAINNVESGVKSGETIVQEYDGQKYTLFNVGDVLIEIQTTDTAIIDELKSHVETSLKESQCKSLHVEHKDFQRNQWISGDNYTGLQESTHVTSSVDLSQAPNIQIPSIVKLDTPIEVPESPLPAGIPEALPNTKPEEPQTNTIEQAQPPTGKNITYQIPDLTGAGCGWEWSGFNNHEPTDLEYQKEHLIKTAITELDNEANAYIDTAISEANKVAENARLVTTWNEYATTVNDTYSQWEDLAEEREKIRQQWEDYAKEYNYAKNFVALQKQADAEYKDAVKTCKARTGILNEWNKKYTGSEGQPGVPPKPTVCEKAPERPTILDETQPALPEEFVLPEGVTIPKSWTQLE